ncbi:MAG: RAMP superfamily protein [Pelotomaculum sp. PtaB.Bin013]|nr:MAG: RAMP superfamily protein [Pelotomaculum sp. PtaB.Bin013]
MEMPFLSKRYFLLALDPVHIGTGGYRLGRVDNTIIREPGTNLPKIPGTSLSGALRSFMAMREQDANKCLQCAGQGQILGEYGGGADQAHCGKRDCPVCMGFGFSRSRNSFQGLIQLSDAQLLLFPVYSCSGPVWITSPGALMAAGVPEVALAEDNEIMAVNNVKLSMGDKLNLGWLLLRVSEKKFVLPEKLITGIPEYISNNTVLVSDYLFSRIINDNLEVRTSVSIDPDTGAARDKSLFTYEAIPRTAILQFEVTINEPGLFRVPPDRQPPSFSKKQLSQKFYDAAEYMQWLGIGGMNTRGMGRLRVIHPSCGGGE